jgi:hypothetical protein
MTTEAHLTIEAVFDAYFDCRRTKRNSINQLRFEADLETNLVALYRDLASGNYKIGRSLAFVVTYPKIREVWAAEFRDRVQKMNIHRIAKRLKDEEKQKSLDRNLAHNFIAEGRPG